MSKSDITFTVETFGIAQRPYGDTYRHYTVESTQSMSAIFAYCTKILCPAISKAEFDALPTDGENFGNHFKTYYTELKILKKVEWHETGKSKVSYKCVQPSTS